MPPAGNRASKLVDLGFPVTTLVPWEPDAFAEPVALSVCEALSLFSSFCVAVGLSVARGAELCAACDEASESIHLVSHRPSGFAIG